MPTIVWWIVGVGFVAPGVVLLGLFVANRLSKGNPGKTMGALWAVLAVMLALFLGFGIFQGNP